jgi:hypothetical protein
MGPNLATSSHYRAHNIFGADCATASGEKQQHAQLRRTTRGVESRRAFNHSRDKETDGH